MQAESTPFELNSPLQKLPAIGAALNAVANRVLALDALARTYRNIGKCANASQFAQLGLEELGVAAALDPTALQLLPETGPAVVVANHPYGGLEGLLLIDLLLRRRSDVRLLANQLLWRIPELRSVLIPLDVLDPRRKLANVAGLRTAIEHVRGGGLLALFPAGAVSHLHLQGAQIVDPTWNPSAARLIRKCNAPVTPVYFEGKNSLPFQLAGLVHPLLRTALLPRELVNKRDHRIVVKVGSSIPAAQIQNLVDDKTLASRLRLHTYGLAEQTPVKPRKFSETSVKPIAIAAELPANLIAAELDALSPEQELAEMNGLKIVYAHAAQIPWSLQELGRLRELTFRAAGEGTGRSVDIDLFDNYYVQLMCWNPTAREIVGAYRIGAADQIIERYGLRGLYTQTLFKYGSALPRRLGKALELGRSFVRPEYQRSFAPLLALWRGIAEYVIRHPQYRVLFGPVSISNDYLPASRLLLVEFLKRHCFDAELSRLIKPRAAVQRRHPLASLGGDLARLSDLDTLSELLTQLEPDRKGVPVLLRQYLKLGGKLLGFNVDAQFGDSIDGLIMVDLPRTELKTLQRYMGREEAQAYLARHAQAREAS
jgi:putative hemolysin